MVEESHVKDPRPFLVVDISDVEIPAMVFVILPGEFLWILACTLTYNSVLITSAALSSTYRKEHSAV